MALTKVDKSLLETTSCTASATTFLRGDGTWNAPASGGFTSQQFITSGNWTRPADITKVMVEVQGAGAGGGHSAASASGGISGGGGAGGYVRKIIDVSSISSSTLTIGAGGGDGADGGATIWNDGTHTLTGTGGIKGENASAAGTRNGGLGGVPTASGGSGTDLKITGQSGISGYAGGSPSGGDSTLGLGGHFRLNTTGLVGGGSTVATGYGGGGCGSYNDGSSTGGGSGSGVIVIVWEYK